jgi:hypothetical protein
LGISVKPDLAQPSSLERHNDRVLNVDKIIEPIAELHTLVGFRRPGRRRIGALSLICCAIAALCVGGLLSALAKNLGPKATINDVGL